MKNVISSYTNGNYRVSLFDDGSKIREYTDEPKPVFPESLDCKITNYCDLGCLFCFVPGTMINMADGSSKVIEDIQGGDLVYAFNGNDYSVDTVGQLYSRTVDENLVVITLDNDTVIKLTANHEVYTQRGWIQAGDLLETDELLDLKV